MQHEGAEQHHGGRRAGDAEGDERDERPADAGIVGGLGRDQAGGLALAEALGMRRAVLRGAVGDPARDVLADAGHGTDADADQGRADDVAEIAGDRPEVRDDAADRLDGGERRLRAQRADDLRNGEGADQDRHDLDAGIEGVDVEGVARVVHQLVAADAGERQAEEARDPALDDEVRAGQRARDDDAEEGEQEELVGGELQRQLDDEAVRSAPARACRAACR
ncbi:MAG: hypothetical protein R3C69_16435 [Geminicoccaceae bacterium]